MQKFNIDKKHITLMRVCVGFFTVLALVGTGLPFLPGDGDPRRTLILSGICTVFFGAMAFMAWRSLRKLPYKNIVTDEEGLWYGHVDRGPGLVPWKRISRIKERLYLQCLDLMDGDGRRLIRVEYQVEGFERLREMITDRVSLSDRAVQQNRFFKPAYYHLAYLGGILVFLSLGIYLGGDDNPMLVYGFVAVLVGALGLEYLTVAHGLHISGQRMTLFYPLRKKELLFTEITDIKMADTFNKGNRYPEVWVFVKDRKKPHKLKQLGVDANVLFSVLNRALPK